MSAGGSLAAGDSKFERKGTVQTDSWRDITRGQHNLFDHAFDSVNDGAKNSNLIQHSLNNRLQGGFGDLPHGNHLGSLIRSNSPDHRVPGQASLTAQSNVNPYSGQYTDNTFERYSDEVLRAIGQSRSGPMATRGGTAAQGYMTSDVVGQLGLNREDVLAKNRQTDASIQQGASSLLSQERGQMNQTALTGINTGFQGYFNTLQDQGAAGQLASERAKTFADLVPAFTTLASHMHGKEVNDLQGRGAQTSSSVGSGVNCCFIFLEHYNGVLPDSVRRYRDMAAPENSSRRRGYISMSKWLVPAMRVSVFARTLANHLLVKPLTKYGEWYYGRNSYGWVFWPVKQVWFGVWKLTGK